LLIYLLKAWLVGISIAAPVGPIGILCIRKTLELGFKGTILVGLGAALADSVYGLVAALGLSIISQFLLAKAALIKIVGGMLLLYLAYKEFKNKNLASEPSLKSKADLRLGVEVFLLTLANPLTTLSFMSIFASMSDGDGPTTYAKALSMVLGVFLGSMTWWLILGSMLLRVKDKLSQTWLHRIRYVSALVLTGLGIVAIISGLKSYIVKLL
jgi:putative LysE/RhtB family amino acid efflux pump